MKKAALIVLTLIASIATASSSFAQAPPERFAKGHLEIGIAFEDGAWDLHVHDHDAEAEFEPDEVRFVVPKRANRKTPKEREFRFLRDAGKRIWELPQSENPNLLYLGFGTEEVEPGTFRNDRIVVQLKSVESKRNGEFHLYSTDSFGEIEILMDSRKRGKRKGRVVMGAQQERHGFWVFTRPGVYRVTFEAIATPVGANRPVRGEATYTFRVGGR